MLFQLGCPPHQYISTDLATHHQSFMVAERVSMAQLSAETLSPRRADVQGIPEQEETGVPLGVGPGMVPGWSRDGPGMLLPPWRCQVAQP